MAPALREYDRVIASRIPERSSSQVPSWETALSGPSLRRGMIANEPSSIAPRTICSPGRTSWMPARSRTMTLSGHSAVNNALVYTDEASSGS